MVYSVVAGRVTVASATQAVPGLLPTFWRATTGAWPPKSSMGTLMRDIFCKGRQSGAVAEVREAY